MLDHKTSIAPKLSLQTEFDYDRNAHSEGQSNATYPN